MSRVFVQKWNGKQDKMCVRPREKGKWMKRKQNRLRLLHGNSIRDALV